MATYPLTLSKKTPMRQSGAVLGYGAKPHDKPNSNLKKTSKPQTNQTYPSLNTQTPCYAKHFLNRPQISTRALGDRVFCIFNYLM